MPTDKKYTDLPVASVLETDNIMAMVDPDGNITYQFTFAQLLTFLAANSSVGSNVSFGTGAIPSDSTGKDGDVYIKTDTGQFAQKLSGTWTVVYTIVQGVIGSKIYYGTGAPASGTGINGDTYLRTDGGIFYTKIAGTWTVQFSMATGPAGPRGNSVLNGTVDPISTVGTNGDFYLNTASEVLFGPKSGGAWPAGVSIKGVDGNTLLYGTTNPSNGLGKDGDWYINTTNYYIFGPKASGAWPAGVSMLATPINSVRLIIPAGTAIPYNIVMNTTYAVFGAMPSFITDIKVSSTKLSEFKDIQIDKNYFDNTYSSLLSIDVWGHSDGSSGNGKFNEDTYLTIKV